MSLNKINTSVESSGIIKGLIGATLNGWGYNFYNKDNQLEADDRLIRTKISDYLSLVRQDLKNYENQYREEFLPEPTRAKPFADPLALAFVGKISKLENKIESLETSVRGAVSSYSDKNWMRHQDKRSVLVELAKMDETLMVYLTEFYQILQENNFQAETIEKIDNFLISFEKLFKQRQDYLRVQVFEVKF